MAHGRLGSYNPNLAFSAIQASFFRDVPSQSIPSDLVVWVFYHVEVPTNDPRGDKELICQPLLKVGSLNIRIRSIKVCNAQGVTFDIAKDPQGSIGGVTTPVNDIFLKRWGKDGGHLAFSF